MFISDFEDGLVAEITTFDAALFPAFGLPPILAEARDTEFGPAGSAGGPGSV